MNTTTLERQFRAIGARLAVRETPTARFRRANGDADFTLDIGHDGRGEFFSLVVRPEIAPALELLATDIQPGLRHLLLLSKRLDRADNEKRKFLCGHDERHWFVASVPNARSVSHVADAMEALKPTAARLAQRRQSVRRKDWNRRANAGFIRQGEWFFLPMPDFRADSPDFVLHDEPIRRAGGKPHIVEHLYRTGGTTVYVHRRYPNGLTQAEYDRLLAREPKASSWPWQAMRRNPQVFAQGKIRHPDHVTILLAGWHQVVMSEEMRAANVAFLD